MAYSIRELSPAEFPPLLSEIPQIPKKLFCAGSLPPAENKLLCIVGSRKYTQYGKAVTETLIRELAGCPISIVSGLALGIDSIAHHSALTNRLHTIAVPGSGLGKEALYPRSHIGLAEEIVRAGGLLLSEFENNFHATNWTFPQRNRIMAGMSDAVLVIEAEIKSGTLITSRLATDYNREVMTVPGSIFSSQSSGPHMLIRLGSTPITSGKDILQALGIQTEGSQETKKDYSDVTPEERRIIELLQEPKERDELIRNCGLPTHEINTILTVMEIKGIIVERMGMIHLR